MGTYLNLKNFGETPQPEGSGMNPASNFPLAQQSSIYSLTFDEFQNTLGGFGKDFGSMNMDELLKNIWTAEETQKDMASSSSAGEGNAPSGRLQRQCSLMLPRMLSQKTVDEVWRDLFKECSGAKDGGSHLQQRRPTLGEMTLEEFLMRAGVGRADTRVTQPILRPDNSGFYGELSQPNNTTTGLSLGFQQSAQNNVVLANRIAESNNLVPNQSSNLPMNVSGVRSSQLQLLLQKQVSLVNNAQLASPGTRGPIVRMVDPTINSAFIQGSVMQNGVVCMTGLGTGTTMDAAGSPASQLSSDGIARSSADTSPLSPISGKAMEKRHKRMIKNRESAARSRARKQAYTLELEAEVAKLKEDLQEKLEEITEMKKNQIFGTSSKRRCLRRTRSSPW